MSKKNTILIYCDGSSLGNPGPAGWGVVLQGKEVTEGCGALGDTTNQVAELTAAIRALEATEVGSVIRLHSDSEYVIKGMSNWIRGWLRNGWKTAKGNPVSNRELWESLHELASQRTVAWKWVKGHSGDPLNERADQLAKLGASGTSKAFTLAAA